MKLCRKYGGVDKAPPLFYYVIVRKEPTERDKMANSCNMAIYSLYGKMNTFYYTCTSQWLNFSAVMEENFGKHFKVIAIY